MTQPSREAKGQGGVSRKRGEEAWLHRQRDRGAFQLFTPLNIYHTYSMLGTVLGGKKQEMVSSLTGRQSVTWQSHTE